MICHAAIVAVGRLGYANVSAARVRISQGPFRLQPSPKVRLSSPLLSCKRKKTRGRISARIVESRYGVTTLHVAKERTV